MQSRDDLIGVELKEKSFSMLDPLNTLIRSLNEFILINPKLIQDENLRAVIRDIIFKIYSVATNDPYYFENQINSCLSKQGLNSIPRVLFPELGKSDLRDFTSYQLLDVIANRLIGFYKTLDLLSYIGHTKFEKYFKSTIELSEKQLAEIKKVLTESKVQNKELADKNHEINQNNFPTNFFMRLPAPIKDEVLSYINPNKLKAMTKLRRVSKHFYLFAENETASMWCDIIFKKFKLTRDDIKKIKKDNESYIALYQRINQISYYCDLIREFSWELWNSFKINPGRYLAASRGKYTILEGFEVGLEELKKREEQLREELGNIRGTAYAFQQVDPYGFGFQSAYAWAHFR